MRLIPVARKYRVKGLVQGVGFRPFVWNLAVSEGLVGCVLNDASGVLIEAAGSEAAQERFAARLLTEVPPLARVEDMKVWEVDPSELADHSEFTIAASGKGFTSAGVVPDAATCPACLEDIRNPENRRFGYFHTNCTHCGPRLSILKHIPYDRRSTSMAPFIMCPECQAEYDSPIDRRFHAQPNACPECGPRVWFEDCDGHKTFDDPISLAANRLMDGAILGIKGTGGYQLAVYATNEEAVALLRERKHRPQKPFALMTRDIHMLRQFCEVSDEEEQLLTSPSAPILLLKTVGEFIAESVAPGMDRLGVMLPNTPLHHLLMEKLKGPIVMTSGNITGNPQEISDENAHKNLGVLVDGFLMHNREVVNRVDDSVMRVDRSGPIVLRRARGLAPAPVRLDAMFENAPRVLSLGGDQKSTVGLLQGRNIILSQYIGELENARTLADFKDTISFYLDLYEFEPELIVVDQHPQYRSHQFGKAFAEEKGIGLVPVQHHHAHMAAVLAEHGWPLSGKDDVLGIVLDGTGWGRDGMIWGGEFLKGGYSSFERVAHFPSVPLPGGDKANRESWRNLVAHLWSAFGPDYRRMLTTTSLQEKLMASKAGILDQMMAKSINSPPSSSVGRLLDAVAAALGTCYERQSFEGEAAMGLEAIARPHLHSVEGYAFEREGGTLSGAYVVFWEALLADLKKGIAPGVIAARVHMWLIDCLVSTALSLGARDMSALVLSGGVFQNAILRDGVTEGLENAGCTVLFPSITPVNDGGLAVGQAAIVSAQRL